MLILSSPKGQIFFVQYVRRLEPKHLSYRVLIQVKFSIIQVKISMGVVQEYVFLGVPQQSVSAAGVGHEPPEKSTDLGHDH